MIVFNRSSGQTHLLDAFSAALLREIETAPAGVDELTGRQARSLGLPPGDIAARVAEVCRTLARVQLIDPSG